MFDYPSASHQFDESVIKDYQALMELRDIVLKKLEEARSSGLIGSPQEAHVSLEENNALLKKLKLDENEAELARLFVVSKVDFKAKDGVLVTRAEGEKCPRCWNYVEQLHEHEEHAVCPRCLGVLKENHDGR